jgi:hypothetical protein
MKLQTVFDEYCFDEMTCSDNFFCPVEF